MLLVQEKIAQAKTILNDMDVDCWITFTRESQINGDPCLPFLAPADVTWHSAFIVTKESAIAIVGLYDQKTIEEIGAYDNVIGFVEGIAHPFKKVINQVNPRQIALNFSEGSEICDGLTYGMFLTMHKMLAEISMADRIVSAEKIISAVRQRKTDTEVHYMREAIRHTEEIFALVAQFIRPGVTEIEIAAFMKAEVKRRGLDLAWDALTCPAVFTGPDTASAHYAPTRRRVERGHVLNMDFGVKVNGYCSDMQRTFYILNEGEKHVPLEVQKGFDTIRSAIEQSRLAMAPGVLGKDVDALARRVITDAGYDDFPHGLGHQVGRFSHDGTALLGPTWEKYAQKPFHPLEANMVFTIEPRLTVKDRGVVTIEEMVVVTDTGAEYLSHPQTEVLLIA